MGGHGVHDVEGPVLTMLEDFDMFNDHDFSNGDSEPALIDKMLRQGCFVRGDSSGDLRTPTALCSRFINFSKCININTGAGPRASNAFGHGYCFKRPASLGTV